MKDLCVVSAYTDWSVASGVPGRNPGATCVGIDRWGVEPGREISWRFLMSRKTTS